MMLQISEHCSAKCTHCPFKQNSKFFPINALQEKLQNQCEAFVTLTGGEPLEHPNLKFLTEWMKQKDIPFRIATGGHVPLENSMSFLKYNSAFLGFNVGTDVLSNRNSNETFKTNWWQNLKLLVAENIPWSLTVTPTEGERFHNEILEIQRHNFTPDFLMINKINVSENYELELITWLQNTKWGGLLCHLGE